jgi:ribonuclease D
MPVPILTTTAEVAELAEELARETAIAVDLEADSMHSYREKVCLLQFSTPGTTVLLDPLSGADLTALAPVLADPGIRKIFHAADYDLRCLYRDFGFSVRGLFDTMVACQFLGEEKVGLADVLGKHYGVTLDKQYQRADWSLRPLSAEMVRYAAEDTRHLHRLAAQLEERLREKGRLAWVAEEFSLLEQVRFSEAEGPLFLRAKGASALDRRQLAVLEALLQWRIGEAQRRDCPPFKVLGNASLIELAKSAPKNLQGLVGIEGISPRQVDRYGRQLLEAVEAGMAVPEGDLPVFPRGERREKDPEAERRFKQLREWRQRQAEMLKMEPGVIINNATLEEIARRRPASVAALAEVPGLKNWQREAFGAGLLRAAGKP